MSTIYPQLSDAEMTGKKVLLRAGFDVPMENGVVEDSSRVVALVPTMRAILEAGASLIVMSHQGRPKGKPDPEFSQKPLVPLLEKLLGATVMFAESCVGEGAKAAAAALQPGEVLLLENLRYDPREEKNDPQFARELAELGDLYVNDAFTNCHRAHASMVGVPALLPSYMGLQLAEEVKHLSMVLDAPKKPLSLIVSGAKMETKVPLIRNFLAKGDHVLVGGAIANTFLAAQGHDVGGSLFEEEYVQVAKDILAESAKPGNAEIVLPTDVVVASSPDSAETSTVPVGSIPQDMAVFDIGSVSAATYGDVLKKSAMIIWNGPIGMYEKAPFANGSMLIAASVAQAGKGGAISLIGGGDTIDFHTRYGLPLSAYGFVSTGGGAMLEFIGGTPLPALEALAKRS